MRVVRFLCSDGRVLLGDDRGDGTATVLIDAEGLFGPCDRENAAREMLRGRRALVADDDEGIRMTVARTLEKFECSCTLCADGAQAIDAIHRNDLDLVVSDVVMPHNDGYDVFAAARQRDDHLPVLLMTGFGYDPGHAVVRACNEGLDSVLYKPFSPRQLIEKVSQTIRESAPDQVTCMGLVRSSEQADVARLLAPVGQGDVLVVEDNYQSQRTPESPFPLTMKPRSAMLDPGRTIRLPRLESGTPDVMCGGSLAVVIGKEAANVPEDAALDAVAGLTIANNLVAQSADEHREAQTWVNGGGFNTFCPVGPSIVGLDDCDLDAGLTITTTVNGQVVQQASTREMITPLAEVISRISRHLTLDRGMLLMTGTPPHTPAEPLKKGDEIAVEIDGLGTLTNKVAG